MVKNRLTKFVLLEVEQERTRQFQKFGDQSSLPSVDVALLSRVGGCTPERMAEHYEMPTENRARQLLDLANRSNELTFAHIALEEFAEVIASKNEVERYKELIQTAAVFVQWAESLHLKLEMKEALR